MKKIILFNAETGTLFGSFDYEGFNVDGIDKEIFLYKEVEMSDSEFWYGDYETGRVCDSTDIQVVTQQSVRDRAIEKIFSKYFFIDQIKIITDQLKTFIGEERQTQDFKDMVSFIDEARAEYQLQKEAYSSNPEAYIWISDEQAGEHHENRYKGLF